MSRSVDETYVSLNGSLSEGCIHIEHNLSCKCAFLLKKVKKNKK